MPGKVTKLVPFGAFVRVEEGIEGLVHISALAERHIDRPDQVVAVGDDAMVKVIDIDLERRRISLSLKQANEDYTKEFDPAKYGMADSYDEQGKYIFPEGFDPETNEWREGCDTQRTEWVARYAEAERRHKMHTTQMEKFADELVWKKRRDEWKKVIETYPPQDEGERVGEIIRQLPPRAIAQLGRFVGDVGEEGREDQAVSYVKAKNTPYGKGNQRLIDAGLVEVVDEQDEKVSLRLTCDGITAARLLRADEQAPEWASGLS